MNDKAPETTIHVVSYNILAPLLCNPQSFQAPDYSEEHLSFEYRLPLILDKLTGFIEKRSVIALQEVDTGVSCLLQLAFKERGYDFFFHGYGKRFNGYMGVAIAVPSEMDVVGLDKHRIVDGKEWPDISTKDPFGAGVLKWISRGYIDWTIPSYRNWMNAKYRMNFMITVSIQVGGRTFHVSVVHMPCAFRDQSVMVTCGSLVLKRLQEIAGNDPYILAGDFNSEPGTPCYNLITNGDTYDEICDMDFPQVDSWRPSQQPLKTMRSSVKEKHGDEPEWTNYALNQAFGPADAYKGTLDYIFISDDIEVADAFVLDAPDQLCPNETEPSDHLLIWSTLKLFTRKE